MKKLLEKYTISDKNVNGLFDAVRDSDVELSAAYIKDIYQELFDNTQFLTGDDLDLFTAQVDVSSDAGTKGINKELKKLYGFCDAHGIGLSDSEPEVEAGLEESASDGWDDSLEGAGILYDLEKLIYEIKKGRRGVYTKAHTYAELADYVSSLADRLSNFAENISEYEEDDDVNESLVERELSTKERSISKIFVDNRDRINKTSTKEELVSVIKDLLKDVSPERTTKIFAALNSKKDYFRALQYIYDFILKGDDLGVIREDIDVPSAEDMLDDAQEEAEKELQNLDLEEDIDFDFDSFDAFDDDIDELDIEDSEDIEAEDGDYDDVTYIDIIADDDGQRTPVTFTNECTPSQLKTHTPTTLTVPNVSESAPAKADEVDVTVEDGFEADDIDFIEMKD